MKSKFLNPDLHIASLNKSAKFDVEIRVGKGTGYVPAVENASPDQAIGVIRLTLFHAYQKCLK